MEVPERIFIGIDLVAAKDAVIAQLRAELDELKVQLAAKDAEIAWLRKRRNEIDDEAFEYAEEIEELKAELQQYKKSDVLGERGWIAKDKALPEVGERVRIKIKSGRTYTGTYLGQSADGLHEWQIDRTALGNEVNAGVSHWAALKEVK